MMQASEFNNTVALLILTPVVQTSVGYGLATDEAATWRGW